MKNFPLILATMSLLLGLGPSCALAMKDDIDRPLPKSEDNMKGEGARVHEYDEIVSPDMESASSLANRARSSLKNGNVSRALSLAKKAMKMDDDDIDIHLVYAQAMQAKLERQTEKDPELFKSCLHEYLLVMRNEVGMEKGMTFKGLSLMGNYYNDEEHGILAKKQLIKLTGYAPKIWETDNHFMARVTKPAETAVSGKVKAGALDSDKSVGARIIKSDSSSKEQSREEADSDAPPKPRARVRAAAKTESQDDAAEESRGQSSAKAQP